jgi:hypothetical protein
MKLVHLVFAVLALSVSVPALAQVKPADNMAILRDKIRADKKLVVAHNMNLTEAEAKAFWPIYEAYQKDLQALNKRMGDTILAYAKAYNAGPVSDATANKLMSDYLAIEDDEVKMKRGYAAKLAKALPAAKAVRYLQIENKIRALVKYEIAAEVPLVD